MQTLLVMLVLGGLIILVSQNWAPVLPLVLFGQKTAALPVALWVALAFAIGVLTSIILQLLNYQPAPTPNVTKVRETNPPPPTKEREKTRRPPSNYSTQIQDRASWETPPSSEWEPITPRENTWNRPPQVKEPTPLNLDKEKPRQGTQPKTEGGGSEEKTETVYDANYRIITPPSPNQTRPPLSPDEEEWV